MGKSRKKQHVLFVKQQKRFWKIPNVTRDKIANRTSQVSCAKCGKSGTRLELYYAGDDMWYCGDHISHAP